MQRFGASRTPLREAMKVLATKGLIEARQRAGTRVRPREDWDLLDPDVLSWHAPDNISEAFTADLVELRELIEPMAARLAASRATGGDLDRVEGGYQGMAAAAAAGDYESFYAADKEFHLAVLNASHNQLVQRLAGIIGTVLGLGFRLQKQARIDLNAGLSAHYDVLAGIRDRDPRLAERGMREAIGIGKRTLALRRSRHHAPADAEPR
jgi:DNA-binding FadR family transcriptional regulator